jgi:glycosyltransferase involved in cell wall biosynthesis
VVATEHLTLLARSRRRAWIKRLTAGAVRGRICVSEASARPLRDEDTGPVRVVANAVPDPGDFRPPRPGPLRVGSLATLERRKRLDVLIEAVARLPEAELHLAGDGPLRGALEAQARGSAGATRIHFHGRVEDPYAFLREQHVLALCSELEAMPLSVLEALAAGRGAVCRDLPGLDEVLTPACGRLVPSADPAVWAAALGALTEGEVLSWGRAARERYLEAFTMDRMVRETEAVYAAALENSR